MSHLTLEMLATLAASGGKPGRVVTVPVPELGPGTVAHVGEMSADERDARIEVAWLDRQKREGSTSAVGFRAFAVAASLCDPQRAWLAADVEATERLAAQLGAIANGPVGRIFHEVARLNGLTKEDVEALEKNSPATSSAVSNGGSSSDSAAGPVAPASSKPASRRGNGKS